MALQTSPQLFTTTSLFEKLQHVKVGGETCVFSKERCEELVPVINEINELKYEQNAVILAHSYVSPEIIFGVSDFNGDSYGLSLDAQKTSADKIVFAAVKFMAETAKILNPEKEVFVPSTLNGCSLADSITGDDVRQLKEKFPEHTFVCYINTTAEVKAECDVCVTSSNVYKIVEAIPNDKIFFVPDKLMGLNLQQEMERRGVHKDIQLYDGVCYVHEQYDPEMIEFIRLQHPEAKVLSHPECSPGILNHSDYVGSTSQMIDYVRSTDADAYFMLTECGLTSRLQVEVPEKNFVGSCTQCKYMKANTLHDILRVLKNPNPEDTIRMEETLRAKAEHCIQEMFRYTSS
jgi:quinolinate synthase